MVYRYRGGCGFREVNAQVLGETVEAIKTRHDGRLTPADVVEESRPENAPLHTCFTWSDSEAARKCREDEARRVIRSYVVVTVDDRGEEREEIANISVAKPYDEEGPAYLSARSAMEDPELRERIIALAKSQLDAWQVRYAHIQELAEAVELVRLAREAAARPAAVPGRRRPRRQPAHAPVPV